MYIEFEYSQSEGQMFEGHQHDIIEIYFLISGQRYYFIDGKAHLVMPRDLVIIRENIDHKVFSAGIGTYSRYILYADREFINTTLEPDTAQSLNSSIDKDIFVFKIKEASNLEIFFHKMQNLELNHTDTSDKKDALKKHCTNILKEIDKSIIHEEPTKEQEHLSYVNKNMLEIAEYINNNHADKITLDHLSSKFNLSKFYICKLFKKSIGMTFSDFLNNLRITEAKSLLENTELSISQISKTVGYNDTGYFCRMFKKTMQITALKYRKQTKADI